MLPCPPFWIPALADDDRHHAALFRAVCRVFPAAGGERPVRHLRLRPVPAARLGPSQPATRRAWPCRLADPAAGQGAARGADPRSRLSRWGGGGARRTLAPLPLADR